MNPEPAPSWIVARLLQTAEELEQWARRHRRATLAEHEQGVLRIFRRVMGEALGAVVTRALELDQPVARRVRSACPGCGRKRKPHSWRRRQLLSVCGAVGFERPYYYCRECRQGRSPADETLGLAPYQALSAGCAEWLALVGGLEPFRPAAALLDELTGLGVGAETVRTHAEAAGGLLDLCRQQAAERVLAEREPAEAVDAAVGVLVVQADGVMVRYLDDWHEVKLGLVSGCTPGWPAPGTVPDQDHALIGPTYLAARAPAAEFGPLLLAEAARRGALEVVGWEHAPGSTPGDGLPALAVLREVVVLGDGAPWIWALADEHFGARRTEILDWFHASEHLWTLAKALYGQGTPATAAWVEQALGLLRAGGATALLAHLETLTPPDAAAAEALRLQRGYFAANASRMDYPAYRARGLPIGSGAVESAAKHLVQARLKRAGMRWSFDGAQALLALAASLVNHHPRLRLVA